MLGENKIIIILMITAVLLAGAALIVTQTGLTFNKDVPDNLTMNTTISNVTNDSDTSYNYTNSNPDTGISDPGKSESSENSYTYSGYSGYSGYNSYSSGSYQSSSYSDTPSSDAPSSQESAGGPEGSETPSETASI